MQHFEILLKYADGNLSTIFLKLLKFFFSPGSTCTAISFYISLPPFSVSSFLPISPFLHCLPARRPPPPGWYRLSTAHWAWTDCAQGSLCTMSTGYATRGYNCAPTNRTPRRLCTTDWVWFNCIQIRLCTILTENSVRSGNWEPVICAPNRLCKSD